MNVSTHQELAKLAQKSKAAQAIFKDMSDRERFRREYNLKRLFKELQEKTKATLDEREFLQTFKDLEAAGLGSIVLGRGKTADRWIWSYNLKDVARCAKGEIEPNEIGELPDSDVPLKKVRTIVAPSASHGETLEAGGSALDIIIIRPYSGSDDVQRIRIGPDKEKLFLQLLDVILKTK